jgi:hypothetical protein
MLGNDVVDLWDPETRPGAAHPRFDVRVFDPTELAALARSRAPNQLRWVLWAAKEAAYKAAKRMDPTTLLSPRRFVVSSLVRHPSSRSLRVQHPTNVARPERSESGSHLRDSTCGSGRPTRREVPRRRATTSRQETRANASARVFLGAHPFDVALEIRAGWVHAVATSPDAPSSLALVSAVERLSRGCEESPAAASRAVRTLARETLAQRFGVKADRLAVVCEGRLPRLAEGSRALGAVLSLSHHGQLVAFACQLWDPPSGAAGRAV